MAVSSSKKTSLLLVYGRSFLNQRFMEINNTDWRSFGGNQFAKPLIYYCLSDWDFLISF